MELALQTFGPPRARPRAARMTTSRAEPEAPTEPISLENLGYGARVLDYRIEQELRADTGAARLFLADDERRAEYVLLVVSTSLEAFEAALAGAAAGTVLRRSKLAAWCIAAIELNDNHLGRFGHDLLAPSNKVHGETKRSAEPSAARLNAGDVFAQRYRIEGLLGRGGMGEVYRAHDPVLCRTVAIKLVRVDVLDDTETRAAAKERLLSEARVVCGLRHPNVVELFDASEIDGIPYLVLELCEGGNLRDVITKNESSAADRLRWLTEIAEGLACAHASGIVHRDIKPENILLTANGVAKIGDFGIAKALGKHVAETFSVVGTPRYMAPEQLMGQKVDGRVDQFAWALVAQELYSGAHPRERETPNYSEVRANSVPVPPVLAAVVARAMATEVRARFANFDALLKELRRRRVRGPAIIAVLGTAGLVLSAIVALRNMPRAPDVSHERQALMQVFDARAVDADIVQRCRPAARSALASGLQLWRDASRWEALPRFDDASQADPECAVASLYYVLGASHTYPKRREHFRRARELRANLNDRELRMLDVIESLVSEPPDPDESGRRGAQLATELPHDVDVQRLYVSSLLRLGRVQQAREVVGRVAREHSEIIPTIEFSGAFAATRARDDGAADEHFARCLAAAPDSADCLYWKGLVEASKGECRAAETSMRRLISVMPHYADAHSALGNLLLVSTVDPTASRGAFQERWRNIAPNGYGREPTPDIARMADEFRMHLVSGDLKQALASTQRWNEAVLGMNAARFRAEPMLLSIELLRELKRDGEARSAALNGLREQQGWTPDEKFDANVEFMRLAYLTGGIDAKRFRELREEWRGKKKRSDVDVWLGAYAGLHDVSGEIEAPVKPGVYLEDWLSSSSEGYARAAEDLSERGRVDDALLHAKAAAAMCVVFAPMMGFLHARTALAHAYDKAGDRDGACRSYRVVAKGLERTPESASSLASNKRLRELMCP
jgi:serine/threonine protein kinase